MKHKNADREMYEREARAHDAGLEQALAEALTKLDALRTATERLCRQSEMYEHKDAVLRLARTKALAALEESK